MSGPVAPKNPAVHAFPTPEGDDVPARVFEHDEIVTGEAVALKIQPASPVQLIAAGGIDLFISFISFFAFLLLLITIEPLNATSETTATFAIMALVISFVIVPSIVESASRGRSVGRWILGVQIVRDDGGVIRLRHAIIRSLVGLFEILMTFGSVAFIATIANARHKRLGDLLAGTYPVSVNSGELLAPPLMMPPELFEWAPRADVTRLPGPLAWRVRQFLNTSSQLDPAHRHRAAASLAGEVMTFVSLAPPAHTHPERFLAAVLVIRRDTEYLNTHRLESGLRSRMHTTLPFGLTGSKPR